MSSKKDSQLTFEEQLAELQKISEQLGSEGVSLDEAIELFEKGIRLSKDCEDKLKKAKQKITKLTSAGGDSDD
ncbi:MAG: exodeoxyribonuclease VII small subunit [Clostridia bacterium]|nr:exodeoxyribonuclease VII small subunit [Clostridia bacterium]